MQDDTRIAWKETWGSSEQEYSYRQNIHTLEMPARVLHRKTHPDEHGWRNGKVKYDKDREGGKPQETLYWEGRDGGEEGVPVSTGPLKWAK